MSHQSRDRFYNFSSTKLTAYKKLQKPNTLWKSETILCLCGIILTMSKIQNKITHHAKK